MSENQINDPKDQNTENENEISAAANDNANAETVDISSEPGTASEESAQETPDAADSEMVQDIEQTFDWDPDKTNSERARENKKERKKKSKGQGISKRIFAFVLIAAIIVCSTLAFRIAENRYNSQLEKAKQDIYEAVNGALVDGSDIYKYSKIIDEMFSLLEYHEYDREAAIVAMLKGYAAGTGDKYAAYYTAEEFAAMNTEDAGNTVGIGVSVIYNVDSQAIEIISVSEDAPAEKAGVHPGDLITHVTVDGEKLSVASLGYEVAVNKIKGDVGTYAEFTVVRNNNFDAPIDFKIERKEITTYSVTYRVCETNSDVGIVKISSFDLTTPSQFTNAVDTLLSKGCKHFVLDVRYNPGGLLISVEAVLSYFLNEGDNIIYTQNTLGTGSWSTAKVVNYAEEPYNMCNVSKQDIGKYKDLDCVVIANGSTASAGELFTATLKEYGIAKVVGTQTFGKGTMQTTYSLARYGLEGAIKLTTHSYAPKSQQSYEGIGIAPDIVEELDEALKDKNIYKITDAEDNQLQKAISVFHGN